MQESVLARLLGRLRFPTLFKLAAFLFVADLFVPDLIPFADEILLGVLTLLLGSWRDRQAAVADKPAEKNVTPNVQP
ncbi:MAG TPA: DUF6116 family protein [Thermoanaerobaculia bacterium]|nr:DUF6116 family protein [Thermoanaerobaculia bacterium]